MESIHSSESGGSPFESLDNCSQPDIKGSFSTKPIESAEVAQEDG
jgi:hypothetical protein